MDDIYDKLEECMNYLKKIANEKDLHTCWSDSDFDQICQIVLMICGCQIRTKYLDDEKPLDVVGPHNSGYRVVHWNAEFRLIWIFWFI